MSEKKTAKAIGAKLVKNSGRGMKKSDMVKDGRLVIDLKEVSKSFTLNEKAWQKVCVDSFSYGAEFIPVLLIEFATGVRLAVMDYNDLRWFVEEEDVD